MGMDKKIKQSLSSVLAQMESIGEDSTVPRNIRATMSGARQKLSGANDRESLGVMLGSVMYMLEDISSDINMPTHTRTEIWAVISGLESIKEQLK